MIVSLISSTKITFLINGSSFKVIDDREGHIPLVINPRVERAISYFQNRARDSFEKWLTRYPYYYPMIKEILDSHELHEELIYNSMVDIVLKDRDDYRICNYLIKYFLILFIWLLFLQEVVVY